MLWVAERLQKFLSRAGVASRRKAEALIAAGAVTVNGVRAELGQSVTPDDDVRVNGVRAVVQAHATFLLYKPAGVLSSVSDDRGRETVMGLLPKVPGLHPVGRLDLESEGLLLVTNDGSLTLQLTHPRYGHEKAYRVWCDPTLTRDDLKALRDGVTLDDGPARAVSVRAAPGGCEIVLREGRATAEPPLRPMRVAIRRRVPGAAPAAASMGASPGQSGSTSRVRDWRCSSAPQCQSTATSIQGSVTGSGLSRLSQLRRSAGSVSTRQRSCPGGNAQAP